MYTLSRESLSTRNMVKISILAAIGMVLMFFDMSLWFAPGFLKLDISDLPGLLGSFAMGPMAGVLVQLVKNILSLLIEGSSTGGVGELSNFIVGSTFVYVAGAVYYREKTFKRAIAGLVCGILSMTLLASLSNYFVVFPLYGKIYPMDTIIGMASKINRLVYDYKSMILFAVVPFNLVKGTVNGLVVLLLYKRLSPILKD